MKKDINSYRNASGILDKLNLLDEPEKSILTALYNVGLNFPNSLRLTHFAFIETNIDKALEKQIATKKIALADIQLNNDITTAKTTQLNANIAASVTADELAAREKAKAMGNTPIIIIGGLIVAAIITVIIVKTRKTPKI